MSFKISSAANRPDAAITPPPGMGAGAAHIEILNRRAVFRPARHRAEKEELVQSQFALKNISFGEAELLLQVPRRDDLAMENDVFSDSARIR